LDELQFFLPVFYFFTGSAGHARGYKNRKQGGRIEVHPMNIAVLRRTL